MITRNANHVTVSVNLNKKNVILGFRQIIYEIDYS